MEDLLWCAKLSQEGGPWLAWCLGVLAVPQIYPGCIPRSLISRTGLMPTN